ncbi:MAG: hypothetical protein LBD17_02250 [Endomicrobium sp.]|jgi:hypothetical protein|nr:hypothetical protein [Endomicrobium sp.]
MIHFSQNLKYWKQALTTKRRENMSNEQFYRKYKINRHQYANLIWVVSGEKGRKHNRTSKELTGSDFLQLIPEMGEKVNKLPDPIWLANFMKEFLK